MAGLSNEESKIGRSFEGFSSGQQLQLCQSGEALAEWRSSAQVENGSPSTSPPYWDSDEDDEGGSKPSDLYGKHTWKIDKFSQINKRELRSNAFEVGGYKWYILIYPQGCDVCNHLSLFLCVANHDKLLPGWSHFAQFTIAVVNKDHKKSKFSDTLHRFWKKEHDWGWKKFMELSKVLDGFIDDDTLTIKAQVQVIRERADQPFRCLDRQYRRELVRVYLTNVEQVCRRFVEERRGKLVKLIDDKARWSSFCAFWLGMDQSSKRNMSQEKKELILKFIVKHFFIEKEVTSTLVMDALYSGLKALEGQNKGKKKGRFLEAEELPIPIVCIEKDTFVLVDDVLLLLGRAAMEPLPPKDDKGPQNRMKDAAGEEFNKDYSEREERRLTELGRRTIEIFVLAHIFSKIEVAYQEAVALKNQEELIREEEAACVAELEQRTRRGTTDKEKKSKKKQGRQKRSNRKGKDKGKDDKNGSFVQDKVDQYGAIVERNDLAVGPEMAFANFNAIDDASDLSDSVDCVPEILPPESEDGAASPVSCVSDTVHPLTETNNSEISGLSVVQNGTEEKSTTVVDDCSSTCSSDSVPSLVTHKGNAHFHKNLKSPLSGWNQQHKWTSDRVDWVTEEPSGTSECLAGARHSNGASQSSSTVEPPSQTIRSSQDRAVNETKHQVGKKEEETNSFCGNSQSKDAVGPEVSGDGHARRTSPPRSPSKNIPSIAPVKSDPKSNALMDAVMPKKQPLDTPKVNSTVLTPNSTGNTTSLKPDAPKFMAPKSSGQARDKLQVREVVATAEKPSIPLIPALSRPSSAPLAPGLKPTVSVALMVQTAPALSRPTSAVGRLGLEPTASATPGFVPQSYRNAMLGVSASGSLSTCPQNHSATSMINRSHSFLQEPAVVSAPLFSPLSTDRMDPNPVKPSLPFGIPNHHNILQNEPLWIEQPQRDSTLNVSGDRGPLINDTSLNLYNAMQSRSQDRLQSEFPACTSGRQSQGHVLPDEFPHLDIINELLDDEHGIGLTGRVNSSYQNFSNGPQSLNRHYSFPGDPGMSSGLGISQSSCRFDRAHSYHGDLRQHCYGASGRVYDTLGDMMPQSGPQTYANGRIDGFMPRQWQMPASSDLPFLNVRHVDDAGGYSYRMPEYQNLNAGVNGYNVFRQPNGL